MVASIIYHMDETDPRLFIVDLIGVISLMSCVSYLVLFADRSITYLNVATLVYTGIGLYFFVSAPDPTGGFASEEEEKTLRLDARGLARLHWLRDIRPMTYSFLNIRPNDHSLLMWRF